MKRFWPTVMLIALLVSVFFNVRLFIENEVKEMEIGLEKDFSASYMAQRDTLLDLIPELKPMIKQDQLKQHLENIYPDEALNTQDGYIQWRLYNFYFENDVLRMIAVGS